MDANQLLQEAEALREQTLSDRRYLHAHPELGFELANTKSFVANRLVEMGYEPQACGKSGLTVLAGGKKPGKVFLIRGDMDALPIEEQSDVDFKSETPGKMHACGHDMHTSMLLAAAQLLKNHEDEIPGTVKLMFQPAEETFEGSKDMIENGVLKHPDVDAGLMIHVTAGLTLPEGSVIVCDGGVSAPAADYFTIQVQGKGCHGAMPQLGIDPITVSAHIITALQEINARELAMADEAALTFGIIRAGEAENVIPDSAVLGGTIRCYEEETRDMIKQRIVEISESIAAAFRATATVTFPSGCPTLLNDADLSSCAAKYTKELLGEYKAFSAGQLASLAGGKMSKSTASEDFAYISHEIPTIMLALAAGQPEKGYVYPQHHPMVKFDDSILPAGACVYAYNAVRWLEEHNDRK